MNFSTLSAQNKRRLRRYGDSTQGKTLFFYNSGFSPIVENIIQMDEELKPIFPNISLIPQNLAFSENYEYFFFISPSVETMRFLLAKYIQSPSKPRITICFHPCINEVLSSYLIEEPFNFPAVNECLYGHDVSDPSKSPSPFTMINLGIDLLPLDSDLLICGPPDFLPRFCSDGDLTTVSEVTSAIRHIQNLYGGFCAISAFGPASKIIQCSLSSSIESQAHLILIDRTSDLITPLLAQFNYEGLLAEYLGIHNGVLTYHDREGKLFKFLLKSETDQLISDLRLLNSTELKAEMDRIINLYTYYKDDSGRNIEEKAEIFKQFCQFLKENKFLGVHTDAQSDLECTMKKGLWKKGVSAAEKTLIDGGEQNQALMAEMLQSGADARMILKLQCLEYLTKGKISGYNELAESLHLNYGLQMVPMLIRLANIGLLNNSEKKVSWNAMIQKFKLISENWKSESDEAASQYLGFAPLSIRIIESAISGDVSKENLAKIGVEYETKGVSNSATSYVIGFIGGCTHSEVNTLRRIAKRKTKNIRILTSDVYTTSEFFDVIASGIPGWASCCSP